MDATPAYQVGSLELSCSLGPAPIVTSAEMSSSYRQRRYNSFNGEKYSGGLNYETAYNLDIPGLRKRSTRAFEESSQARAAVNRLNESVINTGLSLQSTPEASLLGISPEILQIASEQIETRFKLWSGSKDCDRSKNNTLSQIERIEFNNQLVKGDYFAYLHFSDDPGLQNPLQVKIITPDRVQTPYGTKHIEEAKKRGHRIVDGIEFNEEDEEDSYYVKVKKPGSLENGFIKIPRIGEITGRTVMIHGIRQRFGNEARGIPILGHIAHELEKITDYSIMELGSAVANAAVAAVVTPSDDAPATNPMPAGAMVPPSLQQNLPVNQYIDPGYTNIGKSVLRNAGGLLIASLNKGEKYESFDTKRPNVNFGAFVDNMTKYLSASLSIPGEVLAMEFGKSYSASRAALMLFWQSVVVWRDEFISDFCTPVYQSWMLGEVARGNLILPGFDNPNLRPAWQSAMWIGVPLPSLNPFVEERAAQLKVEGGGMSREQDSLTRHNTSFRSNVQRLKMENAQLAEANAPLEQTDTGGAINVD